MDSDEVDNQTDLEKKYNFEKIASVDRFLKVLVEAYPIPINQTEIAKRANVSKALVSKNRKPIQEFCDLKTMAYEKKYVLKEDKDIFIKIFFSSLLYEDLNFLRSILKSEYFEYIMSVKNIYNYVSAFANDYFFDKYFSEGDIEWTLSYIKKILNNYDNEKLNIDSDNMMLYVLYTSPLSENFYVYAILEKVMIISKLLFDKELSMLNLSDIIKILELRDKTYYFIYDNIKTHQKLCYKIIDKLDIKHEKEYEYAIKGSEIIIKYIINNIFKEFTNIIYEKAQENNFIIDEKYKTINQDIYKNDFEK